MSLYDDASLIVYPSGYKESKIYAQKPIDGSGDLTFSRASSATRVNEQGLIETASTLGSELVTNGDFATDITGWLQYQSVSTWDSGTIKTTVNSVNAYIRTNIFVLTGGIQYKVTFKAKASNVSQNIIIYNGATFFDTGLTFDVANTYQEFTYYLDNIASANLIVGQQSLSIGDSINFDNVSVKEVITSNIPRIDYTNGCGQLLLEPQRTNILTQSEDLTQGSLSGASFSSTSENCMNFGSASELIEDTSNSSHFYGFSDRTGATNDYVTTSFYIKKNTRTKVRLYNYYLSNQNAFAEWDLETETIISSGGTNVTFVSSILTNLFDGWVKIEVTSIKSASTYSYYAKVELLDDSGASSYIGDGTSGIFLRAAQLEIGSYPTSYIPTSGTTVTRLVDTAKGVGVLTNSYPKSVFWQGTISNKDGESALFSLLDITTNSKYLFAYTNGSTLSISTRNTTNQTNNTGAAMTYGNFYKVVVIFKNATDVSVFVNGAKIVDHTFPIAVTYDFTSLLIGQKREISDNLFRQSCKGITIEDAIMSDAEAITLTTI
jgi:hypothetical protein